jgi:DNA-binding GntR family transcriptional regulator
MIDGSSPLAPWRQIHAVLRDQIMSGELAPGDVVPSLITISQT